MWTFLNLLRKIYILQLQEFPSIYKKRDVSVICIHFLSLRVWFKVSFLVYLLPQTEKKS